MRNPKFHWLRLHNLGSKGRPIIRIGCKPNGEFEFSGVQIIEFGSHSSLAVNAALLFERTDRVTLHLRFRPRDGLVEEMGGFPGTVRAQAAHGRHVAASLKFYWNIAVSLKRRDLIWVTTAPEHSILVDLVFLWLLLIFCENRVVISVRDANNWMTGYKAGFISLFALRMRKRMVGRVRRIVFETQTQSDLFLEYHSHYSGLSGVSPTMFSDGASLWEPVRLAHSASPGVLEGPVRIGLLGGVDPSRRDFAVLRSVLENLSKRNSFPTQLVILGSLSAHGAIETIRWLEEQTCVESHQGFLPQPEFLRRARTCDILVAPLREGKSYGLSRGSGVFGDALISGVKVAVPYFADPGDEFAGVTIRYRDSKQLEKICLEIAEPGAKNKVEDRAREFFSSTAVRGRLFSSLQLRAVVKTNQG